MTVLILYSIQLCITVPIQVTNAEGENGIGTETQHEPSTMYRKGPHGSFTGWQLHKQHVFVKVVPMI